MCLWLALLGHVFPFGDNWFFFTARSRSFVSCHQQLLVSLIPYHVTCVVHVTGYFE